MKRRISTVAGVVAALIGLSLVGPATPAAQAQAAGTAAPPAGSGVPATAGPDLLREPIATAPPLTNAAPFRARPILVSGALAYRAGELLYQDFLFDDHGADGVRDPTQRQPYGVAVPIGTYTYPTGDRYHGNDADLVELRVLPRPDRTLFRVTLNTLVEPGVAAFTLALGRTTSPVREYPHGAGVHGPADLFVTVAGTEVRTVGPGSGRPTATVDRHRQQVTVSVPRSRWDPASGARTIAAGVGLWSKADGRYLVPGPITTETQPGGSGTLDPAPAFFNVAFRSGEPIGGTNQYWSNSRQAASLAAHDMAPFTQTVDFGKLRRGVTDERGVPRTGSIDRIMSSHFDLGEGVDLDIACSLGTVPDCTGPMLTQLQPYNVYVPPLRDGASRFGLTVLLHSLNANHNQYAGTKNQSQYALRDQGTIVMTPLARGPDGSYYHYALADVFEVWADVAAHYPLDPRFTSIGGYSMGGYGTFQLASAYPDLFARGHATVGSAYPHQVRLPSLRHVPVLMWNGVADELVPVAEPLFDAAEMTRHGLRFELDLFPTADHFVLAINDEYGPGAEWLGAHRVDPNPAAVTFVVNPIDRYPHLRMLSDHAYWLSDLVVRTPGDDNGGHDTFTDGRVDALSHAFGTGLPAPSGPLAGAGVLEGGVVPALPYTRHYQEWGPTPRIPRADRLDLTLVNLKTVTVDVRRAGLTCGADVRVTTDGPVDITLAGCDRVIHADAEGSPVLPLPGG